MTERLRGGAFIGPDDLGLLTVSDDPDEIVEIVRGSAVREGFTTTA
jgi:hypothetical protein